MNDLHSLHDKANNAMVRLLSNRVLELRSRVSHISAAIEIGTGSASFRTDAAGQADAGSDIGGCESEALSMSMFASKADYDAVMLQQGQGPIV